MASKAIFQMTYFLDGRGLPEPYLTLYGYEVSRLRITLGGLFVTTAELRFTLMNRTLIGKEGRGSKKILLRFCEMYVHFTGTTYVTITYKNCA